MCDTEILMNFDEIKLADSLRRRWFSNRHLDTAGKNSKPQARKFFPNWLQGVEKSRKGTVVSLMVSVAKLWSMKPAISVNRERLHCKEGDPKHRKGVVVMWIWWRPTDFKCSEGFFSPSAMQLGNERGCADGGDSGKVGLGASSSTVWFKNVLQMESKWPVWDHFVHCNTVQILNKICSFKHAVLYVCRHTTTRNEACSRRYIKYKIQNRYLTEH